MSLICQIGTWHQCLKCAVHNGDKIMFLTGNKCWPYRYMYFAYLFVFQSTVWGQLHFFIVHCGILLYFLLWGQCVHVVGILGPPSWVCQVSAVCQSFDVLTVDRDTWLWRTTATGLAVAVLSGCCRMTWSLVAAICWQLLVSSASHLIWRNIKQYSALGPTYSHRSVLCRSTVYTQSCDVV